MIKTCLFFPVLCIALVSFSQEPAAIKDTAVVYRLNPAVEIPLVIAGIGCTAYNFSRISNKKASEISFVLGLRKKDVNWFDRWGVRPYDSKSDNLSYIPFYTAIPLPLLLFATDKRMRKDYFRLSFLYVESLTITGILYSAAAGYTNRLRPLVYSNKTPLEKRLDAQSKKSFFAGHVALVASSAFFAARVLTDYYPAAKYKWRYYAIAGALTLATGYMRQAAGEHFPSDILLGAVAGGLSGILTPSLHQHKLIKSRRLSLVPAIGNGAGFAAYYRL